jgi:uncharacterized protein (DUF1330 family)
LNKGLLGFLIFLGLLAVGLGVVGYVLGPNVLAFIFHAERKSAPVVLVDLVAFADPAAEQGYRRNYLLPARALIEAAGGKRLWSGHPGDVAAGGLSDAWSWLQLVEYPSRSAVIELVTSSDYRALAAAQDATTTRRALLAATPLQPFTKGGGKYCVVRFVAFDADDALAGYEARWAAGDAAELAQFHGVIVWHATLNPLSADAGQRWDAVWIYAFPNAQRRSAWLDNPRRATQAALERHLFRRDVLIAVDADGAELP